METAIDESYEFSKYLPKISNMSDKNEEIRELNNSHESSYYDKINIIQNNFKSTGLENKLFLKFDDTLVYLIYRY